MSNIRSIKVERKVEPTKVRTLPFTFPRQDTFARVFYKMVILTQYLLNQNIFNTNN